MIAIQAALFGIFIGGMIISLGIFLQQRHSVARRRLHPPPPQTKIELLRSYPHNKSSFLSPELIEKIEDKLHIKKDGSKIKELQKMLIQAGIYHDRAVPIFLGVRLGVMALMPVVIVLFLSGHGKHNLSIGILIGLCILGYFVPGFILSHLVKARQQKIREALPDALDLMVVCVEAGQGLNAAIKRVSDDMMESNPIIAQEMGLVNLEIMAGLERNQALKNLGDRTGVEELISMCTMLIQSDRFGTSIGQALKTHSDFMRTTRRQKLEELAAKTPVKLLFPLLLFIFPAILVVILGPAVIQIGDFFSATR